MIVEILTIGDEVVAGNIINTNTVYIADQLWQQGYQVEYHSSVRDDADKIKEALLLARNRADFVLVTGGLGPTADDFTLEIAAKTFNQELNLDQDYLKYLEELYKSRGRILSENNKKQAYVPKDGLVFKNKIGTAPGIAFQSQEKWFYFMAGVPREMKHLFHDYVLPHLNSLRSDQLFFKTKLLKCFGIAESDLDQKLQDLYQDRVHIDGVRVGFRAHFPEIFIKLSSWDLNEKKAEELLHKVEQEIQNRAGEFIYGENDDTLELVVGNLLRKNNQTLSLAESCTGGFISSKITDVSGSSDYFLGGVISYSNEVKQNVLEVKSSTLEKYGAVSSEVAIEMAKGVKKLTGSDYAIAVTGIAGPTGATPEKPVGTVHIALVSKDDIWEKEYCFNRGRSFFKEFVYAVSLNQLRKIIFS